MFEEWFKIPPVVELAHNIKGIFYTISWEILFHPSLVNTRFPSDLYKVLEYIMAEQSWH